MRRRDLIKGIAGSAIAWPLAASAQQGERMRLVGGLMSLSENDPEGRSWITAFEQSLADLGWSSGRNLRSAIAFPRGCWNALKNLQRSLSG